MPKNTFSWLDIGHILSTNLTALFFARIHFYCLFFFSKNKDKFSLNLFVSLLGGVMGWISGVINSPVTNNEQLVFSQLGAAIATFLSGYVVAKVDRFLEQVLFDNGSINKKSWISALEPRKRQWRDLRKTWLHSENTPNALVLNQSNFVQVLQSPSYCE